MGNVRTWMHCKLSFQQFFKHLNADVFVTTYNLMYDYHPAVKGNLGYYDDQTLTDDEIHSMFDGINIKTLDIENNVDYSAYAQTHPSMNHETSYRQCRKLKRGIDLIKQYETLHNFKYDYIIKTRCDLIYNTEYTLIPQSNCVINNDIGSSGVFPNDWIFVANRDSMEKMATFMVDEFFYYTNPSSNVNPPHQLLHNAVTHCGMSIRSEFLVNTLLRVPR